MQGHGEDEERGERRGEGGGRERAGEVLFVDSTNCRTTSSLTVKTA